MIRRAIARLLGFESPTKLLLRSMPTPEEMRAHFEHGYAAALPASRCSRCGDEGMVEIDSEDEEEGRTWWTTCPTCHGGGS